ncbi:MAG: hypothetical protein A2521_15660 [Deltaproteobacteria bacterium RIFOXYD12_FULL_57_12]|nr:MAG: hypothetical protein A2521_15660 [Deltaproteobacteria bacterium RIFOXYD12_FULL_57_12]
MSAGNELQPSGEKMRQAIRWFSEEIQSCPQKNRHEVMREAEIRFDLSPRECEFLHSKFCDNAKKK